MTNDGWHPTCELRWVSKYVSGPYDNKVNLISTKNVLQQRWHRIKSRPIESLSSDNINIMHPSGPRVFEGYEYCWRDVPTETEA